MSDTKEYRILVINPGSTSTKVGYFINEEKVWDQGVSHSKDEISQFAEIQDQFGYRKEIVEQICAEKGIDPADIDIFVGRGGGMVSCPGGVYEINDILIRDCIAGAGGAHHPANLASQIARAMAEQYGGDCFTCNPPDVDEMIDIARPTGLKEIFRKSSFHALNQKEIAHRYATAQGKRYEDLNLVIAHIGGGTSISAHRKGKVIDTTSLISGNGPMMTSRAGEIDTTKIVDLAFSGEYDRKSLRTRLTRKGGLMDHLGTDSAQEVERRIAAGDAYAKVVYDAMNYQICKHIGGMTAALQGKVDQIILTGGMSNSKYIVNMIREFCSTFGEITVMAGEFELEALAAAGLRAKRGEVPVQTYTGIPMFKDFEYLKEK
ncbi:MAG: butyrate kinase [Mogibacterium sp.]|nr:butyrate kinase [Mogibacterium sp.]